MAMDVKLIRLVTGEELITEIVDRKESFIQKEILIKNPLRVMIIPSKSSPQNPTVGFAPWSEFSDDKEFILDKSHILCIMNPVKEFVNQYNATFGGIITPQSPGLILPGA
jgi:hypothetical protein